MCPLLPDGNGAAVLLFWGLVKALGGYVGVWG